jgi:hypothetical protein
MALYGFLGVAIIRAFGLCCDTDRTASAKDAASDIQRAVTCSFLIYARLPGLGENSREF